MRKKLLEFLVPKPKVNKTKLDEAKSGLSKAQQELKGSTAKLKQTQFEIANKLPITFTKTNKKTPSNTELQKAAKARKKEEKEKNFEKVMKDNKKVIKRFFAPENFNKGGRVGLKRGTNLGMQSVKYGLDNKPEVTKLDRIAKFIAKDKKKKNKKFKTPMDQAVKKDKKKKRFV